MTITVFNSQKKRAGKLKMTNKKEIINNLDK